MKAKELKQDGNNYRKHSDKNKRKIKKSIDEAGFGRSVVIDADGVLVCGNGVQSVIDGNTPVKVVETDGTELVVVKRTDLHEGDERRKLLALADNATADGVEWDVDKLSEEWGADTLAEWDVNVEWVEEAEAKEAQDDDFDEDKDEVETVCKNGDIWQLGQHRLMCGDSTDAGSVALLMDGEKADIAFTSPPYNANKNNIGFIKSKKVHKKTSYTKGKMYNEYTDDLSDEEYGKLLCSTLQNCIENADDVLYNVGILSNSKEGVIYMLNQFKSNFIDILFWNKNNTIPMGLPSQLGLLNHKIEPVFCFNSKGNRKFSHPQWHIGKMMNEIVSKNAGGNKYSKIHHATFPVEFAGAIVSNFASKDGIVMDCFGGTGTTMIACEQLNRKCYMMELDDHYCDVIIARWEKLTGKKAVKVCNVNETN